MVTDEQVRRLRKLSNTEKDQEIAASKAGMDPTTARRYLALERLPSELKRERHWRTREDPFGEVWDAVQRPACQRWPPNTCLGIASVVFGGSTGATAARERGRSDSIRTRSAPVI